MDEKKIRVEVNLTFSYPFSEAGRESARSLVETFSVFGKGMNPDVDVVGGVVIAMPTADALLEERR